MSVYDWPKRHIGGEPEDNALRRAGFMNRRRFDFDLEGALAAGRALPDHSGPAAGPLGAPPSSATKLWIPLGPSAMFGTEREDRPRYAGRVKMLQVDDTGTRVYAASGNGGVWFSPDGGASWSSLGGFVGPNPAEVNRPAQRHSSGAIFVDFKATAAQDIVYVGTGEPSHDPTGQPGGSLGGIGILVATGPASAGAGDNPWTREAPHLLGAGCSRFATNPAKTVIVVATTAGLYQRPAVGGDGVAWDKVAGTPFHDLAVDCTDVLWTAATGAQPERLWVWVRQSDKAGLYLRDAPAVDFVKVSTPEALARRSVLAASTPPDQIFVFNDRGGGKKPLLFRVAPSTPAELAAEPAIKVRAKKVLDIPDMLGRQGFYDMSVAVHPAHKDRVVLTGNTFKAKNVHGQALDEYGAVIIGDVEVDGANLRFGKTAGFITNGVGVHADVHYATFSNGGNTLWVTCDGGIYRSDHPDSPVGFVPVNQGLAIAESNYIVSHPACEGFIIAGLQDNGVVDRVSDGVWVGAVWGGDGGGIALDPLNPSRYIRQHDDISWSASDGSMHWNSFKKRGEPEVAAFYSTPASIAHKRGAVPPAKANIGQIILGTARLWYTEDFGANWTTLPTGGPDPLATANVDVDAFGQEITVCKWQSPDVAWVLGEGLLKRYARTPGSDNGGTIGTWTADMIIRRGVKNKKEPTSAEGPIRDAAVWTDVAVNLEPDTNADGVGEPRGTKGAVYLGTVGSATDTKVDTLWWFNGTDTWFPTGLRDPAKANVPAPVTAIACDPDHPEEVWVGTTVGVWKGIRTLNGTTNPPTWAFETVNNGLPEAAIEDLHVFSNGTLRLLRAAVAARGVWELRLDTDEVVDTTYVRAHGDDLRYRMRAVEVQRDGVTARSWHGSPDVRPRRAPARLAAPGNLPWVKGLAGISEDALRRFQAALRLKSGDPRVKANGRWDEYFNEVLRELGAPASGAPSNVVSVTEPFWTATMLADADATAELWPTPVPTEADLFELTAKLDEGVVGSTSCGLPARPAKVEVVVHHRGIGTLDGANVRVTLLKWLDPKAKKQAKFNDPSTWFTAPVPWNVAANEVLNSSGGTTSVTFGGGWSFVGTNAASRRKALTGQTLGNGQAGVASFDLNLTGLKPDRVILLAAVIRAGVGAGADVNIPELSLQELALTQNNIAVRSMKIGT